MADLDEQTRDQKITEVIDIHKKECERLIEEKQKAEIQNDVFASLLGELDGTNLELTKSFEKMNIQYKDYKQLLKIYNDKVAMYLNSKLTMGDLKILDAYSIYELKEEYLEHIYSSHDMRRVEKDEIVQLNDHELQDFAFVKVVKQNLHREHDENYYIAFFIKVNDGTKWVINILLQAERKEIYELLTSEPTEDEILLSQRKDFTIIYLEGLFDVLSLLCAMVQEKANVDATS